MRNTHHPTMIDQHMEKERGSKANTKTVKRRTFCECVLLPSLCYLWDRLVCGKCKHQLLSLHLHYPCYLVYLTHQHLWIIGDCASKPISLILGKMIICLCYHLSLNPFYFFLISGETLSKSVFIVPSCLL